MTQIKIALKNCSRVPKGKFAGVFAEHIGLTSDSQQVTLRFIEAAAWGQPTRYVCMDRQMAEELATLLNYELDRTDWR